MPKKQEEEKSLERKYMLSISNEDRQKSFAEEDQRWETNRQIRDWILLIAGILFWVAFQLSIYFLIPGL